MDNLKIINLNKMQNVEKEFFLIGLKIQMSDTGCSMIFTVLIMVHIKVLF